MRDFFGAQCHSFFYVSPALRFIPMKYRGCRFNQGYELRFVARKTDIVAESG